MSDSAFEDRLPPQRVTRRTALRRGGQAMLGAVTGVACGARATPTTAPSRRAVLAPVDVSWERIIRRVVGLRPYRPAGFRLRGWAVTIYAKDLPPGTTSNVAGGQWTPASVFDRDVASPAFVEQFASASRIAYRYYQDFVGAGYGVSWIDNYYLSDEPPGESWMYNLLPDVFASAADLEPHEHPFAASSVQRVRTMLIEPAIYLNALLRDVHVAGGKVIVGELRDRQEVAELPERVVINCTGLGAAELFGDEQLMPVKGQLTILFPQPEVDYIAIQRGLYMFPRSDGILLGGTFERGDATLDVDDEAERRIVEGHQRLFGSMRAVGIATG